MEKIIFPNDFLWGAATAAYQIEGAFNLDGKGESIWDRFSHTPGRISDNKNGDFACDHYHTYKQDIAVMKEIGLQSYRLSISWPRIFPNGVGEPNRAGIDFYKNVLKELQNSGIKAAVTLYHWDLPQKLQDMGGWTNPHSSDWFEAYARYIFEELNGLVDIWITLNEPYCTAFLGHWYSIHAPGLQDFSAALLASHNLLLAHGKAVRAFRQISTSGEVGIALNMNGYYPKTDCEADLQAAELSYAAWNSWFSDPILKGHYPELALEHYRSKVLLPEISQNDLDIISTPIDFLGLNNYSSEFCEFSKNEWPLGVKVSPVGEDRTDMGWGIHPDGLHWLLTRLNREYSGIKLYITENGCATRDVVNTRGEIEDSNRIDYLRRYLAAAHNAIAEGVNLKGYFLWSLMDNFEWSFGFSKRFGIVYTDYKTNKRIIKNSGYWYRDVIMKKGFDY